MRPICDHMDTVIVFQQAFITTKINVCFQAIEQIQMDRLTQGRYQVYSLCCFIRHCLGQRPTCPSFGSFVQLVETDWVLC